MFYIYKLYLQKHKLYLQFMNGCLIEYNQANKKTRSHVYDVSNFITIFVNKIHFIWNV